MDILVDGDMMSYDTLKSILLGVKWDTKLFYTFKKMKIQKVIFIDFKNYELVENIGKYNLLMI